jgi:acyl-CoA reductase-like NAD-dependent aldehyde dehydrogenase
MAAAIIRASAEGADHLAGKVYGVDSTSLSYQLHRPVGVTAGIIGWNFPLMLAAGKIAPALIMGNSQILKPSELTSLSAARLAELALEAGVPEGVLNVIHGDFRAGAALAHHADIDLLTFTGSTHTGKRLLMAAGQSNMKRLILECGGKAPAIVFEDAPDLQAIAEGALAGAFWNQGQVCTASSRLLVQASVKEELVALLIEKAARLEVGDPLQEETRFGALVSGPHRRKVLEYVDGGIKEGARRVYRSEHPSPFVDGFYAAQTILDHVSPAQKIAKEEVFGPVLSVISFEDEQQAIDIANGTIYGLSAVLWTRDVARVHRLTQAVQAGWIVANTSSQPRGGPGEGVLSIGGHKQSGLGVEGGLEGLAAYTTQTAVQVYC